MMDKDKLRKADIFSGLLILASGIFIVSQALKMPMKDSWGGVQNVWYVSPAIFPLFVGAMISLLGALLIRTAIKEVGMETIKAVVSFVFSPDCIRFLKLDSNVRFYAVTTILLSFVFLFIPRVDFFPGAILFLLVFISMFYLEDIEILKQLIKFYLIQVSVLFLFFVLKLDSYFSSFLSYPGDVLTLLFIPAYAGYAYTVCRHNSVFLKKFKTSILVAVLAPIIIGMIFKYFLLVPMPFEGLVVELMDAVWYM